MADRNERAMSPVVGKAMEATIVVLYIGLITTVLYGGAVPEYRASAGDEIADRTVAAVSNDIERSIPPAATQVDVRIEVDLPATIAGDAYRIHATNETVELEHPNSEITARTVLVLPDRVVRVTGTWDSGETAHIRVKNVDGGLEVVLE